MNLLLEFIAYLLEMVAIHSIFVWGGQGQMTPTVCESWIRRREQDTGGERTGGKYRTYADIAVDFWKKQVEAGFGKVLRAFDCSGLVVYWLLKKKLIDKDINANGLYGLCKPTTERKAGYWVFRIANGRATHIGVLIDENTVVHAKGRAHGVVKEDYNASPGYWHAIGIPKMFDFSEPTPAPDPEPTPEPTPAPDPEPTPAHMKYVRVRGKKTRTVHIRTAPNKSGDKLVTAHGGDTFRLLGIAETEPHWYNIEYNGRTDAWITNVSSYTEVIDK